MTESRSRLKAKRSVKREEQGHSASNGQDHDPITYIYHDVERRPLIRVVRRPGKKFHQEQFTEAGWVAGIAGVQRVLYNLPEIHDAAQAGKVVWLLEGEKDANACIERGLIATTNLGGAGKWRKEYTEMLRGVRRVNMVWDDDKAGREHALRVEAQLREADVPVRLLRARAGNDATDHFAAGFAPSEFIIERPGPPQPTTKDDEGKVPDVAYEPGIFQLVLRKLREHADNERLPKPKLTDRGEWEACCPAHEDRNPSLGFFVGEDQPLVVNCQAGCTMQEIAHALEIDPREFSDSHAVYDIQLQREVDRQRIREQARIIITNESVPELPTPALSAKQYMTEPPPEFPYLIDQLHVEGGNTLMVAQYKTGKTTFAINLYRSLVNVESFLNHYDVVDPGGKIAYLDYEMQEMQFRMWLQSGGDLNYSRMATPWHLRGKVMAFWTDRIRKQLVEWLVENNVTSLIIDTAARAWSGLVENENSNTEILRFTDALDQLKDEAGVSDLFVVTHMGRSYAEEGSERARGATRLEDWMDGGWYLIRDKQGQRYFRAAGRGIDVESIALTYNPQTRQLTTSGTPRKEYESRNIMEQIVDVLATTGESPTTTELRNLIHGETDQKQSWIYEAEKRGLIERVKMGRSQKCLLTEAGRALHERRVSVTTNEQNETGEVAA